MPRPAIDENSRLAIRLKPSEKAMLIRAAALERTNLTAFVLNTAIKAAETTIERDETVNLTARDSQRVMDLLESPPDPNARLMAAARALKGQ
ncbi:MAG: ABC transporter [Phenylobacterium zucineum]|nr:MAG: ABC transporter [Phenylobacterium zucineum]